ncbi:MAG: DUF3426 domain-containing protein [Desulfuromonadaceae bacterium]
MIIQCEKCQTRFRLDDSRVTDKGVKVRCTKCKHVFRVHREGSQVEPFAPGTESVGLTPLDGRGDASAAPLDDLQLAAGNTAYALAGFDRSEETSDITADFGSPGPVPFEASAMSFESDELGVMTTESAEPAAIGGEVDFSGFDFGEAVSEPDSAPLSTVTAADFIDGETGSVSPVAPRKEALQGLDFSDDDMFGAVVQPTPEESGTTISFDFEGDDSFAESMDMGGHDSSAKSSKLFSLDTAGDAPFSLDEIDFGDELTSVAVQQVNPEDLKPSQEMLFAPLAEAQVKSVSAGSAPPLKGIDVDEQHELPPLSIASRRKQSPLFGVLIAVVALLVVSVLGYIGYSSFSAAKSAIPDSGRISVRAVKAVFVDNEAAGQLLVISGEALNEFPKPRAALQVKVSVFDAAGQSIAAKSAYGGNPLTEEQLASLPLDKIEAAMANQFGDSLANMEVAPGSAIPFVVVIANLPGGAKDFAVQSSGSTVATGKQ